jgi:hypothetical protein
MKYFCYTIFIVFTYSCFGAKTIDINKKPPKKETIEHFAMIYMNLLIVGKEKEALAMCDDSMKEWLTDDGKYELQKTILRYSKLKPEKYYTCRIIETEDGITEVGFQTHDTKSKYPLSTSVYVKKKDGKFYVTDE